MTKQENLQMQGGMLTVMSRYTPTKVKAWLDKRVIVRNGVHQDGQGAVVTVGVEGKFHFSVFELEGFHG